MWQTPVSSIADEYKEDALAKLRELEEDALKRMMGHTPHTLYPKKPKLPPSAMKMSVGKIDHANLVRAVVVGCTPSDGARYRKEVSVYEDYGKDAFAIGISIVDLYSGAVANAHDLLPKYILQEAKPGDWSSVEKLTKKLVEQAVSNIAITRANMEIEHA
jgi:hypothetical protein